MSGDAFSYSYATDKKVKSFADIKRQKVNLNITKRDWCEFEKFKGDDRPSCDCELDINQYLCSHCVWKKNFDIPAMIEEAKNGTSR